MLRYQDVAHNKTRLLALTSLTREEFTALVPAFEPAFLERMQTSTIDGLPRLNRRYIPYKNSPLPAIEDKLLFILIHLKQHLTQEVQGQMFGMIQSDTNKWLHVLRPVLLSDLQTLDAVPSRPAAVIESNAAPVVKDGPFFIMMGRSVQSSDLKHQMSSENTGVGKRKRIRSRTSC